MSQKRIEAFEAMVRDNPDDAMVWYGLAGEYLKLEQLDKAIEALRNVIRINADYTAAYQMLGTALVNQGQHDEARRVWQQGVAVATRTGAAGARQHMERLLATTSGTDSGFCK